MPVCSDERCESTSHSRAPGFLSIGDPTSLPLASGLFLYLKPLECGYYDKRGFGGGTSLKSVKDTQGHFLNGDNSRLLWPQQSVGEGGKLRKDREQI